MSADWADVATSASDMAAIAPHLFAQRLVNGALPLRLREQLRPFCDNRQRLGL